MRPEDLINERQVITQSNHSLIGGPFNVSNDELRKLADYVSYRKIGVKCGKRLNPLEALAVEVLERHSRQLKNERFWKKILKR